MHFATLMVTCHLKKRRTGTEVSEVQRSSCTSWRHHQRRHRSARIPFSTEIYWCHKVHLYRFGRCTRKTDWRSLECRWKQKLARFVDRFHEIYSVDTDTPKRIFCGPGGDWQKIQTTTRPDHIWPEAWMKIGKAAQKKKTRMGTRETETWECQKFERISFHWSKCDDYKDIIKNARRKLETPMAAAMPCKRTIAQTSNRETVALKSVKAEASETKTRFGCVAESQDFTRPRIESVTKRSHEDHIAVKRQNSVLHHNLAHKFQHSSWKKAKSRKRSFRRNWKKKQ